MRHWQQDLQIALVDASPQSPVSTAYMDMNGLKALNDQKGHDTGDRGLRMYFQAVASGLFDAGEAYRLGADEVLAVFPGCDAVSAAKRLEVACHHLMEDSVRDEAITTLLSISVGIVAEANSTARPTEVRNAADKMQIRAKTKSRRNSPRPSVIAIEGTDEMRVLRPEFS